MQTLFVGQAWRDVTAEHVEAFLAEQEEEGLIWEAKGTTKPHRDSVRKAVCGFANSAGGYLIIGAERATDRWTLPGIDFDTDEAGTWLSSLIAPDGVTPVPWYDIKVFARPEGRHAAVVAVEPTPTPPCMTASGIVYQRVTSTPRRAEVKRRSTYPPASPPAQQPHLHAGLEAERTRFLIAHRTGCDRRRVAGQRSS